MRSSSIGRLEKDQEEIIKQAYTALDDARTFSTRARLELKEHAELRVAREQSDKRLEDNKRIIHTLAELLPPYVAKVRDVQTGFEDFDKNFPKLEKTVNICHARSRQTGEDIDALRKQVGTLTQRQEAFIRLSTMSPILLALAVIFAWYAIQR